MRGDKRKVSFIGLLQSAAVVTVVFSFLTGFDIRHHEIELFSHFRLQYFVVSVLLLILFTWLRHYGYAGALGRLQSSTQFSCCPGTSLPMLLRTACR